MHRIILASASPSRRAILSRAGVTPTVMVSEVDEDAAVTRARLNDPREIAGFLARAKAEDVAVRAPTSEGDLTIVIGCDSVLELDGVAYGKPHTRERARDQWRLMNGREALLHTGHWIIVPGGEAVGATSTARLQTATLTDEELEAYLDTEEPLEVAGALTIDGFGGPFITRIDGDHHGILGLSLPLCRELLARIGVSWVDFWDHRQA